MPFCLSTDISAPIEFLDFSAGRASPFACFIQDQRTTSFIKQHSTEFAGGNKQRLTTRSHRRYVANIRERRRMKMINTAFDGLRARLPPGWLSEISSRPNSIQQALSPDSIYEDDLALSDWSDRKSKSPNTGSAKVDILRGAIAYINALHRLLAGVNQHLNLSSRYLPSEESQGRIMGIEEPILRRHTCELHPACEVLNEDGRKCAGISGSAKACAPCRLGIRLIADDYPSVNCQLISSASFSLRTSVRSWCDGLLTCTINNCYMNITSLIYKALDS
ncbi:hypothetical protein T265_06428 [Opisthorchis viverrini]|uniref:BHLH domain-containing protein n=1 Tax=Opisthorchis viverrini TaxID=6198 RepID=A0A074ZG95_OPIVI|nr:hypothetical protein T265_06428 [Opisthorchis viverrini]KER26311.1 hypothetical protein T265_06428 [Opisthorchis viverrini]